MGEQTIADVGVVAALLGAHHEIEQVDRWHRQGRDGYANDQHSGDAADDQMKMSNMHPADCGATIFHPLA